MNPNQNPSYDRIEEAILNLEISKDKSGFLSFRIDESFEAQQEAFKALLNKGYSSPPSWKQKPLHRFMLEKSEVDEDVDEIAITFEYEEKNLRRLGFIISLNSKASKKPKEDLARVVKILVNSIGQPHVFLNRGDNLNDYYLDTQDPSLACSIFWSGVGSLPPQTVEVFDFNRFTDILSKLGHNGCLANFHELSGSLVVSVDFFKNKKESGHYEKPMPII